MTVGTPGETSDIFTFSKDFFRKERKVPLKERKNS
nr:MAG TPA: hypothetical protein [Caudoviricetes sp.]